MAQKRMFDRAIIDTDKFMDLPITAKALYFLLGMEADDEGFVSYKKVLRIHGGTDDDIKILMAKNFVIGFPSGVVVITDWNKNNWLDGRRIRETEYQAEREQLTITETRKYQLKPIAKQPLSNGLATAKQPLSNRLASAKQPLSNGLATAKLEENRIEEYSIEENRVEREEELSTGNNDNQNNKKSSKITGNIPQLEEDCGGELSTGNSFPVRKERSKEKNIYNNIYNNNINNTRKENIKEKKEKRDKNPPPYLISREFFNNKNSPYRTEAKEFLVSRGLDEQTADNELEKFISYWTELTKSGNKQRWELEKTFEVKRRLATWIENFLKYNNKVLSNNNSNNNDNYRRLLHDGSYAINRFGVWVSEKDPNIKIDLHYYPELK